MDEEHLAAALRQVSLNPVRARLLERAQEVGRVRLPTSLEERRRKP
jgi:hypothetical protein